MTFETRKKAASGRRPVRVCQDVPLRAIPIALFLTATLLPIPTGFTQNIPSGPTAIRKGDTGILGRMPGHDAMQGNLGLPAGSAGSLGGAYVAWACQAEKSQIAKLTELNRLLEEKVSELSKLSAKDKLSLKNGG